MSRNRQDKEQWFSGRGVLIPLAALADTRLKGRSKLVLAAIASFAGPDGRTPAISKSEIAAVAGVTATNLARELRELIQAGWLAVDHQPGANSVYRLAAPEGGGGVASAVPGSDLVVRPRGGLVKSASGGTAHRSVGDEDRLVDAPVFSRMAVVTAVAPIGRGSLVTFALDDGGQISTIFPDDAQPCQVGDTAQLQVRQWRQRMSIAGGSTSGVRWIAHRPGQRLPEAAAFDFLVSAVDRYATPSGLIFVSFVGEHSELRAVASVQEKFVPAGLANGMRIRVSRRDGALVCATPGCPLPQLDIVSDKFRIELL